MNLLIKRSKSLKIIGAHTFEYSVIYSFFYSEYYIKLFTCVLESLWHGLDPLVAFQHVQYAILGISDQ